MASASEGCTAHRSTQDDAGEETKHTGAGNESGTLTPAGNESGTLRPASSESATLPPAG